VHDGKTVASKHFNETVKTQKDWEDINLALHNYLRSNRVTKGFVKNGGNWFENWRDWIVSPEKNNSENNQHPLPPPTYKQKFKEQTEEEKNILSKMIGETVKQMKG